MIISVLEHARFHFLRGASLQLLTMNLAQPNNGGYYIVLFQVIQSDLLFP